MRKSKESLERKKISWTATGERDTFCDTTEQKMVKRRNMASFRNDTKRQLILQTTCRMEISYLIYDTFLKGTPNLGKVYGRRTSKSLYRYCTRFLWPLQTPYLLNYTFTKVQFHLPLPRYRWSASIWHTHLHYRAVLYFDMLSLPIFPAILLTFIPSSYFMFYSRFILATLLQCKLKLYLDTKGPTRLLMWG